MVKRLYEVCKGRLTMKKPKPEDYGSAEYTNGSRVFNPLLECDLREYYQVVAEHYEKTLKWIAADFIYISSPDVFQDAAKKAIATVRESEK